MNDIAVILSLTSVISVMCLVIGGMIGWLARENHYPKAKNVHPDCLDEYGNILPDEILAVTFVNDPPEIEED